MLKRKKERKKFEKPQKVYCNVIFEINVHEILLISNFQDLHRKFFELKNAL